MTTPPREEWYYELGGRAHGPLTRGELEDLVSRCGETAPEIRVRRGADGLWAPFQSGVPMPAGSRTLLQAALPTSVSAADRSRRPEVGQGPRHGLYGGLRSIVRGRTDVAVAVGVWLLANVSVVLFWPMPYANERQYLATLQKIVGEVHEMRVASATDAQWQEMRARTKETLAPILKDLQKSASSSEPARQQLLWSARDLVPRVIGPVNKERDEQEARVKKYLATVEREVVKQ